LGSLYDQIERIATPAKLEANLRFQEKKHKDNSAGASVIRGRVVFNGFVNPDTRSARQDAAVQEAAEAAIERRKEVQASRERQGEFDATQRIEKEVTARMQRLAVNKRNTRIKGKGK
jgi:predicted secreted Zn-dependent protease